jgi:hypothetical protein
MSSKSNTKEAFEVIPFDKMSLKMSNISAYSKCSLQIAYSCVACFGSIFVNFTNA